MKNSEKTILVLGSTGKTGRRVMDGLKARGLSVRGASRSSELPFDWNNPSTWAPVLTDVEAVYVVYSLDPTAPAAADTIRSFAEQAANTGVKNLVFLSGRGDEAAQPAEQAIRESGLDWTIVRASWFDQNFSEDFLLGAVLSGEVALPVGAVGEPFIDVEDIADVAIAALTDTAHTGQVYELTGPRLLTFAQAVGEIADLAQVTVRFTEITMEQFTAGLLAQQVPAEFVGLAAYLFGELLDGRNSSVTGDVERVVGRPPRDFSDYVRKTAATGVWQIGG